MDGCITLIKQILPSLSGSEMKVAKAVLEFPDKIIDDNVTSLAQRANSSPAAVIRFCKHIGFSGYHDFSICFVKEIYSKGFDHLDDSFTDLNDAKGINEISDLMIETIRKSLLALKDLLSEKDLLASIELIKNSSRIFLSGAGASGIVANDLHMKLARLGFPAEVSFDYDMQLVISSSLKKNDLAIVFSYSGETFVATESAKQAKKNGAKIIAITRVGNNTLSKLADVVIKIPNTEALFRQSATLSRLEQLVVVDIIFSTLAQDCEDAEKKLTSTWHAVSHFGNRYN